MKREAAIKLMTEYYGDDQGRIDHALRVTDFAEQILHGENQTDPWMVEVVTLTGIFHDIGIPEAIRKFGSGAAPYQEREGEPIAREFCSKLEVRPDILERICYIVGHHHTREAIDGLDFQIIWEADALVNIPNRFARQGLQVALPELIEPSFRTSTGKTLITRWGREQGLL